MSDTNFNDASEAFLQKASAPGFWHYATPIVSDIDRYFRLRQDRRILEQMPDHLLKDIGIGRAEIRGAITYGRRPRGDAAA